MEEPFDSAAIGSDGNLGNRLRENQHREQPQSWPEWWPIYIFDDLETDTVVLPDGRSWHGQDAKGDVARALLDEGLSPAATLIFWRHGQSSLLARAGNAARSKSSGGAA